MYKEKLIKPAFTGMLVAIGVFLAEFLVIALPPTASPVIKFSIGYLPIILAGVFFGPAYGLAAGVVQDVLGFFLFGFPLHGYTFQPGYTLNAALYGVIPALLIRTVFRNERKLFYVLNYVAAALLFGLATWFFFDIEAVYSRSLTVDQKTLLSGFALFAALGLALFNFLMRKKTGFKYQPQKIMFAVVVMYVLTSLILTPIWIYLVTPGYSIWVNLPLRLLKMPIEVTFYVLLLTMLGNTFVKHLAKPEETAE